MSTENKDEKKIVSKEKLRTIMEAASALTALADEDSSGESRTGSPHVKDAVEDSKQACTAEEQRFLPDYKKPDAALTFPEKLMKMMRMAEEHGDGFCVTWCDDGRSFVIKDCDEFTRVVVPKFFKPTKFSSFTRKLYRWGFRQINRGLGPDDPVIFGSEFFQREKPEEMAQMRSLTAAAHRKESDAPLTAPAQAGTKRSLEEALWQEESQKRMLLTTLLQQQQQQRPTASMLLPPARSNSLFANMHPNSALALASIHHHQTAASDSLKAFPTMFAPPPLNNQLFAGDFGGNNEAFRTVEIVNAAIAALRNS